MGPVEWLLAQIADDEAVAKRAQVETAGGEVYQLWEAQDWVELDTEVRAHIDRHSPWRVLAECAAKRAIVERYSVALAEQKAALASDWLGPEHLTAAIAVAEEMEKVVRLLAQPYAGREGFPPELAVTE